jgi:hypothetical protein
MLIPFEDLPGEARLWIYQADRTLTAQEVSLVEKSLQHLCTSWQAHGNDLRTSFKVLHQQFILLAVDESMAGASGCSIDGSVRSLKEIQQQTGIDFFDRTRVAFLEGSEVITFKLSELKELFSTGRLSGNSITFNNAITIKAQLDHQWKIPVEKSWLVKYLPKTTLQY